MICLWKKMFFPDHKVRINRRSMKYGSLGTKSSQRRETLYRQPTNWLFITKILKDLSPGDVQFQLQCRNRMNV